MEASRRPRLLNNVTTTQICARVLNRDRREGLSPLDSG